MQKIVADFIIYSRKCGLNFKKWSLVQDMVNTNVDF